MLGGAGRLGEPNQANLRIQSVVSTGSRPVGVAVNSDTHRVYVSNEGDDSVTVLDGTTGTQIATVALGQRPGAVAVDRERNLIFVANRDSDTISVIDGSTDTATNEFSTGAVPGGELVGALAVDEPCGHVWVGDCGDRASVFKSGLCAATLRVLDETSGETIDSQFTGGLPGTPGIYLDNILGIAISSNDGSAYVLHADKYGSTTVDVVDLTSLAPTARVIVPNGGLALAIDSDVHQTYIGGRGYLIVVDQATKLTSVYTGHTPFKLAVDPAAKRIYVTDSSPTNTVAVVDEASFSVLQSVTVAAAPKGVAVDESSHLVYVANRDNDSLTILAMMSSM